MKMMVSFADTDRRRELLMSLMWRCSSKVLNLRIEQGGKVARARQQPPDELTRLKRPINHFPFLTTYETQAHRIAFHPRESDVQDA